MIDKYPHPHPKHDEIEALRADIRALYSDIQTKEQEARDEYRTAMEHLKKMGEAHATLHDMFKTLVEKLLKLKDIAEEPLL